MVRHCWFNKLTIILIILAIFLVPAGCARPQRSLRILSGSENETLEPILAEFTRRYNVKVEIVYQGSVDIMNQLSSGTIESYDAIWPANSLWISLGDDKHRIRYARSIMTSPIVIGIRQSLAEELGFVGHPVTIANILAAVNNGKLRFMMTSATQSNSGACAYLGFLSAMMGNPDIIRSEDLDRAELREHLRQLLSGVNRSSGSSGWLKELFLSGNYDAMINYEALIIETNQQLVKEKRESLYAVYPKDGLAIADSPLGLVDKGDQQKEKDFLALQDYLLSEYVQKQLSSLGRRTGIAGVETATDPAVFNPDWGIDRSRTISGITMPSATVIRKALWLYQTELRKPSCTVYCLDFSGSMAGTGEEQLKEAMNSLLDQKQAAVQMIQASSNDITAVIAFNEEVIDFWQITGNSQAELNRLLDSINSLHPGGGTNIYTPVLTGIDWLLRQQLDDYSTAVVLMTDGESNRGIKFPAFKAAFEKAGVDIPVFSIMFGNSSEDQLEDIAELTRARVFDGRKDLVAAFRNVKGYN